MAKFHMLLVSIVVLAFLGCIASAKGRTTINRLKNTQESNINILKKSQTNNTHKNINLIKTSQTNTHENIPATTIEGTIFCVSYDGNDWIAMKGAYARVSCLRYLQESTMTGDTGYFVIKMPPKRYKDCKVFLDRPADEDDCGVPTNTNQGLAGAPLINPSRHPDNSTLYSVGPFVFNPTLRTLNPM